MFKYFYCFIILLFIIGCKSDPFEIYPVIPLSENENKLFTYTNKFSGFYIGNSHEQNDSRDQGWIINDIRYLKDYQIYSGITRDSLKQFLLYPFSFVRHYNLSLKETFTLIDSINAIIWEFESTTDLDRFSFEPEFHFDHTKKKQILTKSAPQLIISPEDLLGNIVKSDYQWTGLQYIPEGKNKAVVLGVVESSINRVIHLLDFLSKNYKEKKEEKIQRIASALEANDTHTNMPEITEAVAWSQLSLDALCTEQIAAGKGIWAGLPYSNYYRGRDNFISIAGALLVNGNYADAREILLSYGNSQLKNEDDTWEGRIPQLINNDEIVYNTADVTWWFIRTLYEYLLYSGDNDFVQKVYPMIKKAIKGAIRHRIDKNFFLVHDDTETWMNTRCPDNSESPRGDRAIEIQALWYTSLQIGSILANYRNEVQLAEHWSAISSTLKSNFAKKYWSKVRNLAYDHLDKDGYPDRKIRPNPILAVYIQDLPGIEPLLPSDQCAMITSQVVSNLTFRYGVSSLEKQDDLFHPWHQVSSDYNRNQTCFNGQVSVWLAGPVISSLLSFNRQEIAFNLFYDMAIQNFQDNSIGSLPESLNAFPKNGSSEPSVIGNISQAMSLAEFLRVFYQDFIGYQPNALNNRIIFSPKIPVDMSYISTNLPYKNNSLSFTYSVDEEGYQFEFVCEEIIEGVDISFLFPGYDPVTFQLTSDNQSFSLLLDPVNQKSYHKYQNLDWHFALPISLE